MLFTRSFIAALLSAVASAQSNANPFKNPVGGRQAAAGQSLTLEWNPTTDGTVSLILRSGSSGNLAEGTPIASNIPNSGSYTWDIPSDIVRGADYTVEIVADSDSSETNFTPPFAVDSTNTTPASTSADSSSAAVTARPSAFPLPSGVTIDTVAHSSTASNTESATNTESSASATDSSESSTMITGTSSRASSSQAPTATGDAVTTGPATQTGAAARATAAAGFLGVVALGALAL